MTNDSDLIRLTRSPRVFVSPVAWFTFGALVYSGFLAQYLLAWALLALYGDSETESTAERFSIFLGRLVVGFILWTLGTLAFVYALALILLAVF